MQPLSGLDAAFLSLETRAVGLQVGAVLLLDPPAGARSGGVVGDRLAVLLRMIDRQLDLVPRFRQRVRRVPLDLAQPIWVDDEAFDLDHHVTRMDAPPAAEGGLESLVANLMSRPLDPTRPLWELTLVEGVPGGRAALVLKLHHAIVDGMGAVALAARLLGRGPAAGADEVGEPPGPDPRPWRPEPPPGPGAMLGYVGAGVLRRSRAGADVLRWGAGRLAHVGRHSLLSAQPPLVAPRSSINGTLSAGRAFAAISLDRARLDVVRAAFATTTNEVVLAVVGGALRRLLDARGEQLERSLAALVPASTRRPGDGPLGNRLSGFVVPLGTQGEDPAGRLAGVARASRAAQARHRVTRGRLLEDAAELVPGFVTRTVVRSGERLGLFDRLPLPFNLVVSSLPGPPGELWCAGARVVAIHPIGPVAGGVGLNVTAMRYRGVLGVGLLGCRRLVPDIAGLGAGLEEALDELVASAGAATARRAEPWDPGAPTGRCPTDVPCPLAGLV
ncbi:MAG TPA: wax ester/triacylglycerol synthase family O-acyltransferase [Acidimicrobiales bacterium]